MYPLKCSSIQDRLSPLVRSGTTSRSPSASCSTHAGGMSQVPTVMKQDRLPREPLPTVVVHLISDALDREVDLSPSSRPGTLAVGQLGDDLGDVLGRF